MYWKMAEREGFEPPIALRLCLISSPTYILEPIYYVSLAGSEVPVLTVESVEGPSFG